MTIKDVLVYIDNDEECGDRVLIAAGLCHYYGAHMAGLYAMRMLNVHPYPYTYLPESAFETLETHALDRCEEAKAVFTEKSNAENINSEFRVCEDNVVDILNLQSRYADLLIIPQRYSSESNLNPQYLISDILIGVACPVLLFTQDMKDLDLPLRRVLVAWDGSHESARALYSAMPLLAKVERVDLVSVSGDEKEAENIALHITRHGIKVNVHIVEGSNFDAGSSLLKQARLLESQLLVMGAYGHSRLRENVLGGATKHVLDHAHLPVLFSH